MAILKMRKLKAAVVRSEERALLKDLTKFGLVQFTEIKEEDAGNLSRETSNYTELKTIHTQLTSAVDILGAAVPEKSSLLSAKPELEAEAFLDNSGIDTAISKANEILEADEKIKGYRSEKSRLKADIEALTPWKSLDLVLDNRSTKTSTVILGSCNKSRTYEDISAKILEATEEAELFIVSEDKNAYYCAIVCIKDDIDSLNEVLREIGFVYSNVPEISLTAAGAIAEFEKEITACEESTEGKQKFIEEQASYRDAIKLAADKFATKLSIAESTEKLMGSEKVVFMEGWVPAEDEEGLIGILSSYSAAYDLSDPVEEEYDTVPVCLKNNKVTNALNMVTNMYSLPRYGTVDPNPWMAPFFILFYGLMMADMGYGIIMVAAGIVALKKIKPRANTLAFCQLLLYCGISTFICGALTGSFFSDILLQLFNIELPKLFSPVDNSIEVLIGALILGFVQLIVGMVCGFIQKCKRGDIASAIFEEFALWTVFAAAALAYFGIGSVNGIPVPLIATILFLLFGAGREAKGFGKITAAFGCIYNTATGWFGDVLSYSRIMALMLAGGVVGQVFNTVATMPMNGGENVNVITVIAFILIFILGHAMNFGLNILGCYVHDLRLQCLEYFGKFYTDGGKPFTPLNIKGKYINTKI